MKVLVELPMEDKQADSTDLKWMDVLLDAKQNNPAIIEQKRRQLLHLGKLYGLTHPKTIKCSQQLDKLINLSMRGQIV
ncbi:MULTISPECIES: aspartyl-phosphate phosphatase Spo0E family protein [Bacillaceae]